MRRMRGVLAAVLAAIICGGSHATAPRRVVALGGDVTETVYALQGQAQLVGVDSTSTWPAQAGTLPQVGYVRQLAAEGILALQPQLILATHDAGPPVVLRQLQDAGVQWVMLPAARSPQAVLDKVRSVGHWLARDQAAAQLIARLDRKYRQLAARVASMPRHPRVLFLMSASSSGILAAGRDTAADAAISLAGGRNAGSAWQGYKPVSAEALAALAPDLIMVMRERIAGAAAEAVLSLPGMAATPAARRHQLLSVDGQALLGFGPRNADQELELQGRLAQWAP